MNLGWTIRRLRAMGVAEMGYRAWRAGQVALEKAGIGLVSNSQPAVRASGVSSMPAWFSLTPGLSSDANYRRAADDILLGRLQIFAEPNLAPGFPPKWNRDPKTGVEVPLCFGKSLDHRDHTLVGDVKYLWEINRHLQLVTLAQAWYLAREPRYAQGCRVLLESWFDQCPYPRGINWSSSLEPAIRLVNWSVAWQLLGGEQSTLFVGDGGATFRDRWLQSVHQQSHFIAGHLSRHSSANNHLLGELLGLLVAATVWPMWPESARWRTQAHHEFETEALKQTGPDGVNREQANWYQHSVMDLMLVAGLLGRASGSEFSQQFWSRLEHMMEYVASIMDVAGHVPNAGDEDGAVLVRFDADADANVFRSLLASGAVLFNRPEFKAKAGPFDDKSRWLLGAQGAERYILLPAVAAASALRRSFSDGGVYVLGDRFDTDDEVRIVADAAPLGFLAIAAHGHADALSLTLSAGGQEVLIDPGTYSYYPENGWRDYFRSTAAHNTLVVDGVDQSVSGGPFLWVRHAAARCESYLSDDLQDRLVSVHDGYLRLADPVLHRRILHYDKLARVLHVADELSCKGQHAVEQRWHIAADCVLEMRIDRLIVTTPHHRLTLVFATDGAATLLHGSHAPFAGWQSRRFGAVAASHTLSVAFSITGNWRAITVLSIENR